MRGQSSRTAGWFMASSLQTLIKILRLEQQKEFENKAVIGGLGRFAYHWAREAQGQAESEAQRVLIETISGLLRDYDNRPPDDRPAAIDELIALAQSGLSAAPQQQRPPAPSRAPEPAEDRPYPETYNAPEPIPQQRPAPAQAVVVAPVSVRERRGYALQEPEFMTDELRKRLGSKVTTIKGVGEARAEQLGKLEAETIGDLLLGVFPRRYDDYSQMKLIRQLKVGEDITVIGTLARIQTIRMKQGATRIEAYVEDDSGSLRLNWFNQPWLEK